MSAATVPASPAEGISRREFRFILTGLMLALTLAALDQNIVATALPRITGEFGGLQHLSWVVTGFLVASTVSAPIYGRLSDLYGRRSAFTVSIGVFLLGSALCGLSRGMGELIAFRTLQGIGAGGLIVLTQTVIGDLVSPRERGKYQGLFTAAFTACSVAGPLLGGVITEYASWRWIFYVNLPLGALALVMIQGGLRRRPPGPAPRLDVLGATLLIAGTGCLLLLLSWGGTSYPWGSAPVLGLGAAAVAAFLLLARVELRAAQPILPPDLFRNRVFVIAGSVIGLAGMALFAAIVFLPLMFQLLMKASPSQAGLMIAPLMVGVIVSSFTGGNLVARTGRYKFLPVTGLAVVSLCYAALAWATEADARAPTVEALLVGLGLGMGLVMPTLTTAIQNAVPRSELGGATATAAFFRSLGGALGVALSGAVLATHLRQLPGELQGAAAGVASITGLGSAQGAAVLDAYRTGLSGAFIAGTGIAGVAFLVVLFLPELPLRRAPAGAAPASEA
jgi:EmrB/QacA subfamily drug resistance transporter